MCSHNSWGKPKSVAIIVTWAYLPKGYYVIFAAACNYALAANVEVEEEVQLDGICVDSTLGASRSATGRGAAQSVAENMFLMPLSQFTLHGQHVNICHNIVQNVLYKGTYSPETDRA